MPCIDPAQKSEDACGRISIVAEQVMYEDEIDGILEYQRKQRLQARGIVTQIQESYKGRGRYLSELLDAPYEPLAEPMREGRLLTFSDDVR
ncbi:MAG: hypothetical protein Q4A07_10810 [Coriobacteriales bacterium]|nr:hypothetical protein [Coriobacteriales bacterium]